MKCYLVGGAVRDQLLHYPYHERDWVVVGATADEMLAQGFQAVGKDFPVFIHPESKEEYALARTERKTGKGYTGFACFSSPDVTLEEDLLRRDLTINAMARADDGSIIDPYNGQLDLRKKLLRHVSSAFTEDPLRVLRIARFYARYAHLGFTIADATLALMTRIADNNELEHLTPERVWKELQRSLTEASPECFIEALQRCHAIDRLMPELQPLNQRQLQRLQHFRQQESRYELLFACLCCELSPAHVKQLCERLKAPKATQQLAQLVAEYGEAFSQTSDSAEQLFQRLESLDAFRRSERLQQFCDCCRLLYPPATGIDQLLAALDTCQNINATALASQGLSGKAIGKALKQQRLQAIENLV